MGHTSHPLAGFWAPFLVHLGVPKCPKTTQKTYFLVALDHFFLKNGLIDMVRGLFASLNFGTYILPTWGPLCTFLGPFGGTQMPQNSIKNIFWLFYTISPTRMGVMIWLGVDKLIYNCLYFHESKIKLIHRVKRNQDKVSLQESKSWPT